MGGDLTNFVAMMNRQAQAFGLKNTVFKNVTGLTEPGHHSSDMPGRVGLPYPTATTLGPLPDRAVPAR